MTLFGAVTMGALGSAVGSLPLFYISRCLGEKRVRGLLARYGKWIGLGNEEYDKTQDWFTRYGNRAVFLCRMIPGVRGIISIPAGIARMPLKTFFLQTFIGSTIWGGFLILLGYYLGDNWEAVATKFKRIDLVIGVCIVLALVALGIRFIVRRRREREKNAD